MPTAKADVGTNLCFPAALRLRRLNSTLYHTFSCFHAVAIIVQSVFNDFLGHLPNMPVFGKAGRSLLVASGARVLEVPGKNHGPAGGAAEGVGGDWRTLCSNGRTDGHEEAGAVLAQAGGRGGGWIRTQRWLLSPSCTGPASAACRWGLGRSGQCW